MYFARINMLDEYNTIIECSYILHLLSLLTLKKRRYFTAYVKTIRSRI
jgi:hypothetical protein